MVNSLVYAYFTTTAIAALFSAIFDLVNMSRWGEISLQTLYESMKVHYCFHVKVHC